jgi:hypothetical protein
MAEMAEPVRWLESEFIGLRDALQTLRADYADAPAS